MRRVVHPPRRILIVRPSALGDVCRSVPIAASFRRAYPEAEIAWVVQDAFADALRHHPAIDHIIPFPRRALGRGLSRLRVFPVLEWAAVVRGFRADLCVDAQGLLRSGLISWASGAPRRFAYADARELSWALANRRAHAPASMHTVDRMLALVEATGVEPVADLALHADPDELAWVDAHAGIGRAASGGRGPVVLAATSRWASKRWTAQKWADLARRLLGRGVGPIALVGGPGERPQCAPLVELAAGDARVVDLIGETSVGRMLAVIARARLVVANDSAAAHAAVGFARPLVALYGPTRTDLVGPYGRGRDVIQRLRRGDDLNHKLDANAAVMARIGVSEVVEACLARAV